ncbi:hypothetical protein ACFB49_09760 [Sphingomonas sp. DBB INV C78]
MVRHIPSEYLDPRPLCELIGIGVVAIVGGRDGHAHLLKLARDRLANATRSTSHYRYTRHSVLPTDGLKRRRRRRILDLRLLSRC